MIVGTLEEFVNERNVFVISHKSGMDERFENVIRYEKVKGFSRMVN